MLWQDESFSVEVSISGKRKRQVVEAVQGLLAGLTEGVRIGMSDEGGATVSVSYKVAPLQREEVAS